MGLKDKIGALFSLRKRRTQQDDADWAAVNGLDSSIDLPAAHKDLAIIGRHRFADYLIKQKLITPKVAQMAILEQAVTGAKIGQILVRYQFLRQAQLSQAILRYDPDRIATEQVATTRIPIEILREKKIIISAIDDTKVYVSSMLDIGEVKPIIEHYYPDKIPLWVAFVPDHFDDFLMQIEKASPDLHSADIQPEQMMMRLIMRAIEEAASDIHIEPKRDSYIVWYRKHGIREPAYEGGRDEYTTVITKLKDRAGLDIAQNRIGQDGSFSVDYGTKQIDLRIATVAGVAGEKAVIRILDPDRIDPRLDKLGISDLHKWLAAASRNSGVCLVCGTTGSGKSTTLNATVHEKDRFDQAVYTIENPVEYKEPFVTSMNINPDSGLNFAEATKNLMRADPDILMIGEIRDEETATQMVAAAETGHLLFSTLHTDSIANVIGRLEQLGVKPHQLRLILRSVLVQKLVRTLCHICHGTTTFEGSPCPNKQCSGGYAGRTIVSECELFETPEDVDRIILMNTVGGQSKPTWTLLIDDAINKMVEGVTTLDELERIFGSELEVRLKARGINGTKYRLPRSTHPIDNSFVPSRAHYSYAAEDESDAEPEAEPASDGLAPQAHAAEAEPRPDSPD